MQQQRNRIDLTGRDYTAIYALSDIHGCHDEMAEAERRIIADARTLPGRKLLLFLGDYVDRGPRSSDVLAHLSAPPPEGFDRYALCGNHDDVFLRFLDDPDTNIHWLEFGALPTLASYGIDARHVLFDLGYSVQQLRDMTLSAMPPAHVDLLRSLAVAVTFGSTLFVHAGIKPGIPLSYQTDEDLMWIREPFLSEGPQLPLLVVHGHTPHSRPTFGSGRIGIDTAVSMGGSLTILKIAEGKHTILLSI
ncbi:MULTISPECIES: metallophosphoesterase [unclassified Rhizobium]|uniref:metallophosphoesterase n=1 Tax=unclassified Rhizobium TaxID=2613769 RepID=UPI001620F615|nr:MULTISPECIES: metallophosphoesterase [unclassified Rhizobium]MBB3291178.1 serine/threonine protein phosphatase 1 [Rhizobium sp. BK252]MBB3404160.1 serine/threonine protein phosphatase 1 [Rhizobium sp. BK289]MBB3418482.1 serine/threonine protein phosphatase 1 [Rhizobium sp. BK284]MBB3486360.1 serine/threonine protein phosphatase 1 [Rhizobium sp. BK347]MDK4724079.1 metallophosphoesterase [Rhizobium sp. CNPSo 3968]